MQHNMSIEEQRFVLINITSIKRTREDVNMGYTADDFIRAAKAMNTEEERGYTEIEEKYNKHKELCNELNELYIKKNKEYGDSFGKAVEDLGLYSGVVQLYHKLQRIINITKNGLTEELEYESLRDNLIDLANYALITVVEMEE